MLVMLNKACDELKPDLIVFTGDNILGNHLRDYRFSSKKKEMSREEEFAIMKRALAHILDIPEAKELFDSGVISGGMIPKVQCCIDALEHGVHKVTILDGRVPHALLIETLTDEGAGTMVVKSKDD
jgi:hypothetical protein